MRRYIAGFIIFIAIVLLGCGAKDPEKNSKSHVRADKDTVSLKDNQQRRRGNFKARDRRGPAENTAAPVEVTFLTRGDILSYLLYSSTLETEQTVDVFSRISGLVEKLLVEEGDYVQKNQPLLVLEQEEYKLEEEKARVQYDKQQADFARLKALLGKNLISQEEFETARLNLRQAELAWKQAKLNLDYTIVRAPIRGVVGERMVNLGDRIQPTNRLFVISNLEEKVVKIYVPQDELPKLYPEQQATILTDVLPDRKFPGWVKRISPVVDPQSGTFKVTVGVKDPQNELKLGMFVNVELIVDTHQNAKLIPKAALIYESERTYFFIVKGDTAQRVELQKGFEDAEKVEVLNDIPIGTAVVILGQSGLKSGMRVKVIDRRRYTWQKNWPSTEVLKKPVARKETRATD